MRLDVSGLMGSSGDGVAAADAQEGGGSSEVGGASSSIPAGGLEEIDRSGGGGNRWPRQETLSLLKIRSEMDVAFRDSSLKGPLWEEVSRKMAELGFQRSAKKCKEKFENVYKYHKRTKDGRASKPDGKTYRFFDQLQALENSSPPPLAHPHSRPQHPSAMTLTAMQTNVSSYPMPLHVGTSTVPSISPNPLSILPPNSGTQTSANPINNIPLQTQSHPFLGSKRLLSMSLTSNSSSSSTSSDEDIQRRRGRKRKWKDFFERLKKQVVQKQEELQKKFLETLERRERDRMAREEAWRAQETTRLNRDHDLLVQERSVAAAKGTAVIAFLQKITEQPNLQIPINTSTTNIKPPENPPPTRKQQLSLPPPATLPVVTVTPTKMLNTSKTDNGGNSFISPSSSRWPKAEIEALIKVRTNLDLKYQENGPKGPLWEEISAAMGKTGYNRNAKRCKEKWENINKYYKKVKGSSKRRPEDSKTCLYFHQLEALYREKSKSDVASFNPEYSLKPDNPLLPIMAGPEQQWPLPAQQREESTMHSQDHESGDMNEDEDEEEDAVGYEIVTNKQPPVEE